MGLKEFGAGFGLGVGVLSVELILFVGSEIAVAFGRVMPQTGSTISSFLAIFVVLNLVQNLLIGLAAPVDFVFGFLVGNLLILVVVGPPLASVIPSVVFGMVVSFFAVAVPLLLRYRSEQTNTATW